MIVPVMAISNLVLTQQIYSEETNGAHAHYREPVPSMLYTAWLKIEITSSELDKLSIFASVQFIGALNWPRVQFPPWTLTGFVLSSPQIKSSTTVVNSQKWFPSGQMRLVNPIMFDLDYLFLRSLYPTSISTRNTVVLISSKPERLVDIFQWYQKWIVLMWTGLFLLTWPTKTDRLAPLKTL